MIRFHIKQLMDRDKLRTSDVARRTGLNRSTVQAMLRQSATRIESSTVEALCILFNCKVGDLLEFVPNDRKGTP